MGICKLRRHLPAPPAKERLGRAELCLASHHIGTWEGSSYFQASRTRSSFKTRVTLGGKTTAISGVRAEDQELRLAGEGRKAEGVTGEKSITGTRALQGRAGSQACAPGICGIPVQIALKKQGAFTLKAVLESTGDSCN